MSGVDEATLQRSFALLLVRASEKGSLPGFAQSARSILNSLSADADNDSELVQTVLSDAGLMQRVLRLANSAMYSAFGGEVSTVTRAIQVLGVQTIAHLALGVKVIESVDSDRPESAATLAEMQKAVLAGFLGRQLAGRRVSLKDVETATVCALLMGLGRLLVAFYLPEAWAAIQAGALQSGDESAAARAVLGGPLEAIGQLMTVHWGLPEELTGTLQAQVPVAGQTPQTHQQWLGLLATAANEGARILHAAPDDPGTALDQVVRSFAAPLGLDADGMRGAMLAGQRAAREHFAAEPAALVRPTTEADRQGRLTRGMQEMLQAARTANLTQLLTLALEYLHSNFEARRSYAFLLMAKDKRYQARYGLGAGAAALLPELQFDSRFQPDLFHAVLAKDKALFIEHSKADNLKGKLPTWWLSTLGSAQSFCVIPLHLKQVSIGFLYVDWAPPLAAPQMDESRMKILAQVREVVVDYVARPRT
jgi:HD-like signal output (HDOD) protein